MFPIRAVLSGPAGDCTRWVEAAIGRAVRGSTGSASVWSRRTDYGTALVVGAVHSLGEGWFGPAGSSVSETIVDPGTVVGVPRLYLFLPDGSGLDAMANPLFELYNPTIAAERTGNRMTDVLPREDFYVAVMDGQKISTSGPVGRPEPVVLEPVALFDPGDVTLSDSTWSEAIAGDLVLLLGYPNTNREPTAAIGRVLSDVEASRAVELLADRGDPEGTIDYDSEVEMIIAGSSSAGMSGGPVVDTAGRLVGILVRASDEHDGEQYVRAVRMSYIEARVRLTFEALPLSTRQNVAGFLER